MGKDLPGILFPSASDDFSGTCIVFDKDKTHLAQAQIKDNLIYTKVLHHTISRDKDFGQEQDVRLVVKNDMAEVYVNDYLTIIKRVRNAGRIGFFCGEKTDGIADIRPWSSKTGFDMKAR